MRRLAEKVVVSRTPATIQIDVDAIPKHEMDTVCRVLVRSVTEAFKNPQFAADYEIWLAARRAKTKEATT